MEFSGPPRPSRDTVSTLVNLSEKLETADIDSLPALADEVAQGQKHQLTELENRKLFLHQLKAEYEKINMKVNEVKNEIRTVQRNIFFAEDQIECKQKNINEMLRDMDDYFNKTTSLKLSLTSLESRLRQDRERYEVGRTKMAAFDAKVKISQEDSKRCKEIENLQKEKDALIEELSKFGSAEEREKLLSGKKHRELQNNIDSLSEQKKELIEALKSLDKLSQEEKEKQKKIKMETTMLQKRNNAQMIRMKRQLQDGTRRTRNLTEEISQLENRINQMKSAMSVGNVN